MNKLLLLALLLSGIAANAQQEGRVGVNTDTPKATLHIKKDTRTGVQGVVLPRATSAQIDSWTTMVQGTMVWNTTEKCIEIYNGTLWVNQCGGRTNP